jgi:hypothetical protein
MKKAPPALLVVIVVTVAAGGVARLVAQGATERAAYVTALDKSGIPLATLSPSDIIVREDDAAREILRIAPATEPMQIAVLLDNSQAAESLITDYRQALPAFIQALAEGAAAGRRHEISLIGLADRPTILADYSPDPAQATKAAERLFAQPGSGAYLIDGIVEITQGIMKRGAVRPVMVVVTTAGPDLSHRTYQQALDQLEVAGTPLHVVIIGREPSPGDDRSIVLDRGPRMTGGSYEHLLAGSALTSRLQRLAAVLTHQFRVTYARPARLIQPERVTVTAARPELTVRGTPVDEPREQSKP